MREHLDGTTTQLCTCWKISRTDGEVFYLTDNSTDIVFDGDTYNAKDTYDRTAIANDIELTPDNVEMFAVLNSGLFSRSDLENGKFDYAAVEVFVVNYTDPDGFGPIKLKAGWLGQIKPLSKGTGFTTDLLGLADKLSASIETILSPECRADLGDSKCKVAILIDEIERETDYTVGQSVRTRTRTLGVRGVHELLVNGDLSLSIGDSYSLGQGPEGWNSVGGLRVVRISEGYKGLPDYVPAYMESTFNSNQTSQTRDLAVEGITTDDLDGGECWLYFSCFFCPRADGAEPMGARVEILDEEDDVVATVIDETNIAANLAPTEWDGSYFFRVAVVYKGIPSGARKVRTAIIQGDTGPATVDGEWAFAETKIIGLTEDLSSELDFDGKYLLCTQGGTTASSSPDYDQPVGTEITDGSAKFMIMSAWRVPAIVLQGTDRANFRAIVIGDTRGRSNTTWYNSGIVEWTEGANKGRATEMKDVDYEGGENDVYDIELWLPQSEIPVIGDFLMLQAGCDQRRETCRDKFNNVINFRGEPDLPGDDAIESYYAQQ